MIILPAGLLSSPVSAHLAHYLPSSAGVALRDGATGAANPLSSLTGFAVLCGYAAALIALAAAPRRRLSQQGERRRMSWLSRLRPPGRWR